VKIIISFSKISKNKRGYIMTLDAIIALTIVLATIAALISAGYFVNKEWNIFESLHYSAENALDIMEKNTALYAVISDYYSGKKETSIQKANFFLGQILEKVNYRFMLDDNVLVERILTRNDTDAEYKTKSTRFISNFDKNFMARAALLYNDTDKNLTYSIANVSYGNSFEFFSGANWTFQHLGGVDTICVPINCSGDNSYTYSVSGIISNDSGDDAIYRLLRKLDIDNDNDIDIYFDNKTMYFKIYPAETKNTGKIYKAELIVWI